MERGDSGSPLCRPRVEAESRSFDVFVRNVELPEAEKCRPASEVDDSQLVGVPVKVAGDSAVALVEAPAPVVVEVKAAAELTGGGVVKRKRGRPPRGQGKLLPPPKRRKEEEEEEEDVCFICFDGGNLVLCDRKGCPKAYHPSCIRRDEAFFRSKAKWNCGWHICSICQKGAHYMCYMCTYSLCKGCTKDADYVCVREKKGFCSTCMRIVMMIENGEQGNKEMAQVDFDDKSSWEYLFKVYWIYLKGKLSLTLDELTQAKNPWGGADMVAKRQSWYVHHCVSGGNGLISERSSGTLESNNLNRKSTIKHPELLNMDFLSSGKLKNNKPQLVNDFSCAEKLVSEKATVLNGCTEWASKELLEFVAHEKNGDASALSVFEVQALLLDYIKRNNLCDPHLKSQILCDSRLKNLFGKPHLGHFEMLKLLESHFLIKEDFQDDVVPACVDDPITNQVKFEESNGNLLMMSKDEEHKTCNEGEDGVAQANGDEYAAIDAHNINLIYLRRSLLESLVENSEEFHEKVVGSIVRIRISDNDQKEERYRLGQVIGTSKVSVPYKIGDKTADVMLEVLNLDKKEAISIDAISNQQFSEEECRHLCQSMRCGLVKRLTVGEVQKKSMALLPFISMWLETKILGLNHLQGRASEKGQKKEHGQYVENLEILKIPEEHQCRLHEVPEIHVDQEMGPNYESADDAGEVDDNEQDVKEKPTCSGFSRNGGKQISQQERDKGEDPLSAMPRVNEGKDACMSNRHCVDSANSALDDWNDQASVKSGSFSEVPSETSTTPLSSGNMPSETDKVWHYQDQNGEIQGPFAMFQLRKWSSTSLFPPDMRIWIRDAQNDAVLLTDALNVQIHNPLLLLWNASLQTQEVGSAIDGGLHNSDVGWNKTVNTTRRENEEDEVRHRNDAGYHSKEKKEVISGGLGSCSSDWTTHDAIYKGQAKSCSPDANHNEGQAISCSPHWDSSKGNSSCSDPSQVHSPLPSSTLSDCSNVTLSHQETGHDGERLNPGLNHGNLNSHGTTRYQITAEQRENQSDSHGHSGQSSGLNLKPVSFCSSNLNSNSEFASLTKSVGSSERDGEMDALSLRSLARKSSNEDWDGEAAVKQQSASSNPLNPFSATSKPSVEDQKREAVENQSVLPNTVQDSGPSLGSVSSMVMAGTQLGEREENCGGDSPAAPKPSVEEWDSSLISCSSLKPTEVARDHVATPISRSDQHTHSSTSQPASNVCTWSTIMPEPIEFSTLAEESVSDLLAEVDAMEFQTDLASPTSRMRCIEELFQDPKNECFSSIEELSPPEPVKTDAFSSTRDIQLPSQSRVIGEPVGSSDASVLVPVKSSSQSITSADVEEETKSTDVLVKKTQPSVRSTLGEDFMNTKIAHRGVSKGTDTSWRTVQGNVNVNWEGSAQAVENMGWGIGQAAARGSVNVNHHTSSGSSVWERQRKYGGERFSGARDGAFHGGNSGSSRGRPLGNRQSYGDGGSGWYSRPPTRVQRVCKFYESGRCKKGAMCDYLHP